MAENVIVSVRWRPLVKRELGLTEEGKIFNWKWTDNQVFLNETDKVWGFDNVFGTKSTNKCVYDKVVKPIVKKALEGYNGTVFAYGQTGSGKTFTMRGYHGELGVIPLAVMEICDSIARSTEREFMMQMEYIEIYNEQIRDLLSTKETTTNKKPFVVENPDGSVVVGGINKPLVATEEQIREHLERGDKLRSTAATNMNEHSSRSHALFRLKIESRRKDAPDDITISQLNLVDLAGSERAAQTGASGQTLKEGCHINKSLFMLGRVINELTTNASHVSYRDSALTRILSPALGGNARTAIICTLTEASGQETKSSLNFSASAKMIKNSVKINQVISKDTIISKQEMEIKRLRAECERQKGSSAERVDNNKEKEMQRQISVLQKMILNSTSLNGGSNEQPKVPIRRMTWHPNQKPATAFKRQSTDSRAPSSMTIINDENEFKPASDFLDKLDEEEEMSKIRQLGVGKKRTLCEISPNKANIQVDKKMRSSAEGLAQDVVVSRAQVGFHQLEIDLRSKTSDLEKLTLDHNVALEKIKVYEAEKSEKPKNEIEVAELKQECQDLRRKLAALEEVKQSTSFDATKLMEGLEAENIALKEKMDEMKKEYSAKSDQLDEKLQLWGASESPDQFIAQIKNLHVQLQEKAKFVNSLEEQTDLKNNEICLLNEQIRDLESQRSNSLNTSTIDEVANLKEHLRTLADALQKEAVEKQELQKQLTELSSKDPVETPSKSNTPIKPGEMTQAFAVNEDLLADLEKQMQANEELQTEIKRLNEELSSLRKTPVSTGHAESESTENANNQELEELKEFFSFETEARKSCDAENISLRKENSELKSQLENLSSLTDISSINEAHLKRSEADFHALECKIAALESNLSEMSKKLETSEKSAKENEHYQQMNAELEYSLEMEKDKSKRRIEELTAELSVLRNTVQVKETSERECQTERNTADIGVQAIAAMTSCGTAVDQDMPSSPEMIFLQEQVRKLNVELAEARANAEGFTNPLQEKIDSLNEKVSKSEELAAKIVGFETELNVAIAEKNAKTEEIEKLRSEHVAAVADKNELSARLEILEKELELMQAATTAKSEDLEMLKLESAAALAEKNQLVSNLENELAESKTALAAKTEEIKKLQADHVVVVADKLDFAAKITGLQNELETMQVDASAKSGVLTEAINSINQKHEDSISDMNSKSHELQKLRSDHDFIHKELSSLTAAKEALESRSRQEKVQFDNELADLQAKIHAKDELIQNLNLEIMKLNQEPSSSFKKPRLSDLGICDVTDVSNSSAVEISIKEESPCLMSRTEMSELGILDEAKSSADLEQQAEIPLAHEDVRETKIKEMEEKALAYESERTFICERISELEDERNLAKNRIDNLQTELENSRILVTKLEEQINATKTVKNDACMNTSFANAVTTVDGSMNTSIAADIIKVDGEMNTSIVQQNEMINTSMNTSIRAESETTSVASSLPPPFEVMSSGTNTSVIEPEFTEDDLDNLNEKLRCVTAERDSLTEKVAEILSTQEQTLKANATEIESLRSDLSLAVSKLIDSEKTSSQETTDIKAKNVSLELDLKAKTSSLVDLEDQVKAVKDELEEQIVTAKTEQQKYEARVQELNQEGSQLKIEIASIKDQLESKSSELLNVQSRAETLQNDLLLKEDKINELSNKISEISEEAKSSTSKSGMLDELRQELSETSKTSQELFEKNKQLYEENKKLLEEKSQQEEVLLQSAIKFKSFQEKIEELKAEQEQLESLKENLAKELEEKTSSLSEYKTSVNELNQERLALFKTIEELEATKVKFEELKKSSDANSKANLDNEHLRKRLEQACEFNDAEVEKRLVLSRENETLKSSLLQAQKAAKTSEEQLSLLQTKFTEVDTLVFEKTEKIMVLEGEVKELQEAKRSLEAQNSAIDPSEIARKDMKIENLEKTLMTFKKEVESVRDETDEKDIHFRKLKCDYEKIESEQDDLKRKLATKERLVKMVEQEFKKNQALLTEKADKVIEMEGTIQKFEQEVERLKREVRLARSSEASDEVVERLRKEKDELKKIATAMETRKNQYKQLLENQSKTKSDEEWSLMRDKLSKYYKLFNEEKKKCEELEKQIASSAALPPRPPLSTQALIGATQAPEVARTEVKETKKVEQKDESPARRTRSSRSRATKEEDENCKQQ